MKTPVAQFQAVDFSYMRRSQEGNDTKGVAGINLTLQKGEFIAVIGRNGSGKSTFVKLFNALFLPAKGMVTINGCDTRDEQQLWEIRRAAGMISQDPDSQIIGTTVAEDVAFGPENLGLPPHTIQKRVLAALQAVAMEEYVDTAVHHLTNALKLRLSLAAVLAMHPDCILLDEAGSMLDQIDKRELMALVRTINRDKGITVVHITHSMEEAAEADRIIVFDAGSILLDGTPAEVFSQGTVLDGAGLDLPQLSILFRLLHTGGDTLPAYLGDADAALELLGTCYSSRKQCDVHQI